MRSPAHRRVAALALAGLVFVPMPALAQARMPVELELVLAIDASGSVDAGEFALQLGGFAAALRDDSVIKAIEAVAAHGIAIALVQWASPGNQTVAVDWTLIRGRASADALAQRILDTGRVMFGETAIGPALRFSQGLIEGNRFDGARRVIDLSGDGATNYGRTPDVVRDAIVARGTTINGLAILNEDPDLTAYYRAHVAGGFGSFVIETVDFAGFAEAVRRKLVREILGQSVAEAAPAAPAAPLGALTPSSF